MAGAYVFPGGRVDDDDRAKADTLGDRGGGALPLSGSDNREELKYRVAAVRELEEEASVRLTTDELVPFAHWVTPDDRNAPLRHAVLISREMPDGQQARHDDGEMTDLVWSTPRDAIERCRRGDIMLPPPTWTTLRQLARFDSAGAVLDWARHKPIVRRPAEPRHRGRSQGAHAAGRSTVSGDGRLGRAGRHALRPRGREGMETGSRVTAMVDQLIELFNKRSMDLPDGVFDRRTQFLVNGTAFEEMLGKSPGDPLVLMLTEVSPAIALRRKPSSMRCPMRRSSVASFAKAQSMASPPSGDSAGCPVICAAWASPSS